MGYIKCPNCGEKVSSTESYCMCCGEPLEEKHSSGKWLILLFVVLFAAVAVVVFLGGRHLYLKQKIADKAWYQKANESTFIYFGSDGTYIGGWYASNSLDFYEVTEEGTWKLSGKKLILTIDSETYEFEASFSGNKLYLDAEGYDADELVFVYDRMLSAELGFDGY